MLHHVFSETDTKRWRIPSPDTSSNVIFRTWPISSLTFIHKSWHKDCVCSLFICITHSSSLFHKNPFIVIIIIYFFLRPKGKKEKCSEKLFVTQTSIEFPLCCTVCMYDPSLGSKDRQTSKGFGCRRFFHRISMLFVCLTFCCNCIPVKYKNWHQTKRLGSWMKESCLMSSQGWDRFDSFLIFLACDSVM